MDDEFGPVLITEEDRVQLRRCTCVRLPTEGCPVHGREWDGLITVRYREPIVGDCPCCGLDNTKIIERELRHAQVEQDFIAVKERVAKAERKIRSAIGLFRSVILCGENYTNTCQHLFDEALEAIDVLEEALK